MTRPFTIDEEVIRRLILRRNLQELEHAEPRKSHLPYRLWRGFTGWVHQLPIVPRARWS